MELADVNREMLVCLDVSFLQSYTVLHGLGVNLFTGLIWFVILICKYIISILSRAVEGAGLSVESNAIKSDLMLKLLLDSLHPPIMQYITYHIEHVYVNCCCTFICNVCYQSVLIGKQMPSSRVNIQNNNVSQHMNPLVPQIHCSLLKKQTFSIRYQVDIVIDKKLMSFK